MTHTRIENTNGTPGTFYRGVFTASIAVAIILVVAIACGGEGRDPDPQLDVNSPLNDLVLLPNNLPETCTSLVLYRPSLIREDFPFAPDWFLVDANPFVTTDREIIQAHAQDELAYRDLGSKISRLMFIDWYDEFRGREMGFWAYEFESANAALEATAFLIPKESGRTSIRSGSKVVVHFYRDRSDESPCFSDLGDRIASILD